MIEVVCGGQDLLPGGVGRGYGGGWVARGRRRDHGPGKGQVRGSGWQGRRPLRMCEESGRIYISFFVLGKNGYFYSTSGILCGLRVFYSSHNLNRFSSIIMQHSLNH